MAHRSRSDPEPTADGHATFLYLHGLNSSGRSQKATRLRERLAPIPVLAPDYPAHRPDEAIRLLSGYLDKLSEHTDPASFILVGSSMGGFYGQFLATRYRIAHLFLINPALTPWDLLADVQGTVLTTADGDTYAITPAMIEATRRYGLPDPCRGPRTPTTLFLDRGDELIDYRIARDLYRGCARLMIFDGGDHAFQHLDEAIAVMAEQTRS
ncbi:YqiA/YcfP family alpha/beta fold hydrolase [Thioalkalicoccus limnaeus]|uniref:YqiA/YcfP family alpha/beta fold hydrolase n=1 Tax=Thioalkalicoccus limnaeus TaxID=120681 RepID=A0ABV4BET5_9GAMM